MPQDIKNAICLSFLYTIHTVDPCYKQFTFEYVHACVCGDAMSLAKGRGDLRDGDYIVLTGEGAGQDKDHRNLWYQHVDDCF